VRWNTPDRALPQARPASNPGGNYIVPIATRIALFAVPTVTAAGLVLLVNGLDAGAGIAVAALGLVAVVSGAVLGYFADRFSATGERG
jgi:hypothetical protein